MLVTPLPSLTVFRLLHLKNKSSLMLVTPSGIVMLPRLVQSWKAYSPMLVTLSGIVMIVRLVQRSKAIYPMLVTLSGIVMLFRLSHLWKASSPMLVTGLPSIVAGITNLPDALVSQSVMVTVPSLISYFKLGLRGASSTGLVSATGFSPHPPRSRGSDMAIRSKFFISQNPNTPHKSNQLQNHPKFITVHGRWQVAPPTIPEQGTMD